MAVLRARGRRTPALLLFLCGRAFGFAHAFLLLPFVLGTLVVLAARRNARDIGWLLLGLVLPLFLKPDFRYCLQTAWVWNLRFPFLTLSGYADRAIRVRDDEPPLLATLSCSSCWRCSSGSRH